MICSGAEGWAHFKDGETEAQTQQGVRQLGTIWFLSTAPGLPPALLPPSAPTPASHLIAALGVLHATS